MSYRIAEFNSGGSRTTTISKMERFVIIANCWKLHLRCCSSPRSASGQGSKESVNNISPFEKVFL